MEFERNSHDYDAIIFCDENDIRKYISKWPYGDYGIVRDLIKNNTILTNDNKEWLRRGWDRRYRVIQFWDTAIVPDDVERTLKKNRQYFGIDNYILWNDAQACDFIASNFSKRVINAFRCCAHPAMKSDFFRLTYLYLYGGLYIDADMEVKAGLNGGMFLANNSLAINAAIRKAKPREDGSWHWYKLVDLLREEVDEDAVCYLHNDVIAVTPFNEIIRIALARAIILLEEAQMTGQRPRAHTTTGPTNISVATVIHLVRGAILRQNVTRIIVFEREPCLAGGQYEYKKDARNWMISEA